MQKLQVNKILYFMHVALLVINALFRWTEHEPLHSFHIPHVQPRMQH